MTRAIALSLLFLTASANAQWSNYQPPQPQNIWEYVPLPQTPRYPVGFDGDAMLRAEQQDMARRQDQVNREILWQQSQDYRK
jgi:hypothetical protein